MEPFIEEAFTDSIRAEAARRFGADPDRLVLLGDHENYVFGFDHPSGERRILRITHPIHRSAGQIHSELHWVNYLRDNGVAIAGALPSLSGLFVEEVGDVPFFASSFEFAPGQPPGEDDWKPDLWEKWGALQGRTHRLAAGYELPDGMEHRFSLLEEPYFKSADENFADQPEVLASWQEQKATWEALPTEPTVYGLIHTDLYQANFHVDDGEIVMFDSDDCGYAWFVEDISSSIYYGSSHPATGEDRAKWASEFLRAYWSGYRTEHKLGQSWIELLPLFLMGRTFMIYSMVHTKWDLKNLTAEQADLMDEWKGRLTTGNSWWDDVDFFAIANLA